MPKQDQIISGTIVDVVAQRIFPATLEISNGRIAAIHEDKDTID